MPDLPSCFHRDADGAFCWRPHPLIVVVSGPSGAGKDAAISGLRRLRPDIHFVVTATSRCPREGETHGVDYYFLSRHEFEERLARGEFIEHARVYDDHYGVLRRELTHAIDGGRDVIMRVDVQGARTLRRLLPDAVFLFMLADSEQEHMRRLRSRGSETEDSLKVRQEKLRRELEHLPEFDYVVLNRQGRLEETVEQLLAVFRAEKSRVGQRCQRIGS